MFVVPCKYDRRKPLVVKCVKRIRRFHPDDLIVVVDSDSEDKSYFRRIEKLTNAVVLDAGNRHYAVGALWTALEQYEDSFVYLLQDSMILKRNVSFVENGEVASLRFFRSWFGVGGITTDDPKPNSFRLGYDTQQQLDWSLERFQEIGFRFRPHFFNGVFGSSFAAKSHVLRRMKELGLDRVLPCNKWQDQAMERNVGLFLHSMGFDPAESSVMGAHHENPMEDKYLKKVLAGRQ